MNKNSPYFECFFTAEVKTIWQDILKRNGSIQINCIGLTDHAPV